MTQVTFDGVLALAQQLAPGDRARLAATLTEQPAPEQNEQAQNYGAIASDVRQMLSGMTIEDMVVLPRGTPEDAAALIRSWSEEDADDDAEESEPSDELLRSLDESRFSTRRLFPDLQQL